MRFPVISLAMMVFAPIPTSHVASPGRAITSTPKLELRLTPERTTIHPGEKLKLRVEIWNLSSEDIIVAQNIDATFGNSVLHLYLEGNSVREIQPYGIGDGVPDPNPDFEKTFVTNWLTLNRGHFYGTYMYLDPVEFPRLRKKGHYTVRAEYWSRGISSIPGWNGGYLKQEDVAKLPLPAFAGNLNSNEVAIQVVSQ